MISLSSMPRSIASRVARGSVWTVVRRRVEVRRRLLTWQGIAAAAGGEGRSRGCEREVSDEWAAGARRRLRRPGSRVSGDRAGAGAGAAGERGDGGDVGAVARGRGAGWPRVRGGRAVSGLPPSPARQGDGPGGGGDGAAAAAGGAAAGGRRERHPHARPVARGRGGWDPARDARAAHLSGPRAGVAVLRGRDAAGADRARARALARRVAAARDGAAARATGAEWAAGEDGADAAGALSRRHQRGPGAGRDLPAARVPP